MDAPEEEYGKEKNPTQKMVKFALSVLVILIVGSFSSTQYFAQKLNYHPALGRNIFGLYPPFKFIEWKTEFAYQFPAVVKYAQYTGFSVVALVSLLLLYSVIRNARTPKAALGIHGAARFACKCDLERAGLLGDQGLYIGTWYDPHRRTLYYLRDPTITIKGIIAGSRSGKTAGSVILNGLSYPNCMIFNDIKKEIWEKTAGWRKKYANNHCIKFDPASPDENAYWNPLDEIRIGTDSEVGDIQNLCSVLVDPEGQGKDHWKETSFSLLMGCVAHVLYMRENEGTPATLHAVDVLLTGYDIREFYDPNKKDVCTPRPMSKVWEEMISYPHKDGKPHELAAKAGKDQLDRPDQEGGSVLSTAKTFLTIYRDPIIARNTSTSHFKVGDIRNADKPVSLYICVQPGDMERLRPLLRLLWTQIVYSITNASTTNNQSREIVCFLDELAALGKMEILSQAISYLAGYGCIIVIVLQDIAQLHKAYGKPDPIMPNVTTLLTYPTGNLETAKYLSELSGETTLIKKSTSNSGDRSSIFLSKVSTSYQEVKGRLLTPDDIMRTRLRSPVRGVGGKITAPGDMLLFINGIPPILCKQPLYFLDDVFLERSQIPPPPCSDRIREGGDTFKGVKIDYQTD